MAELISLIDEAFKDDISLGLAVKEAVDAAPQYTPLFTKISRYIVTKRVKDGPSNDEPPSKKRRLDEEPATATQTKNEGPHRLILEAREISFSLPQRKKLHLGLVQYGSSIDTGTFAIQGRNTATNQVEFEAPLSSFSYALRLPVPEKNQKQYNFCLLPGSEYAGMIEPVIWTVNHGPLKSCKIEDADLAKIAAGPENILEDALAYLLDKNGVSLTYPDEKEFASAVRESHRKSDVAYHVKAHRGSKEGYLFFLGNGIFFGFKKPLSFFPFNEIESISYTSVLQRTFNLNISIRTGEELHDIEFSMLDQQDFAGIDQYIKAHSLQDASLAEARRAKKAGKAKAETNGVEDDQTEIEKAQQELEDEEDEMEEDYDPDEDDSEDGSGSESEDEREYTKGKGRNLVAEELGSEAEDVTASEDEGEEDGGEEEEEEADDDVQPVKGQDHVQLPSRKNLAESRQEAEPTSDYAHADYDDEDQL